MSGSILCHSSRQSNAGLRVLHSTVHRTYKRIMHRFCAHLLSRLSVFAMWVRFKRDLAQ